MDYTKIKLDNERNSHVTKRLNRLSTWKFFKVIYRENIWRMFGFNFLMLLLMLPILVVSLLGSYNLLKIQAALPLNNGIGFSTGAWFAGTGNMGNVTEYLALRTRQNNLFYGGMMAVAGVLLTLVFSGGFAVIRDAFWTGKLSTVGVFRSMWKGIKANIVYAFISAAILSAAVFGIYQLYVYINEIAGILWLAIVVTVILSVVGLFLATFLMILCSVTVTYKQSVKDSLSDAWRLLWLNVLPNLIHLVMALIPLALYMLLRGNIFGQLLLILILMFGGLYFPLVWQTHMMKTFSLFHPVEVKKKKQVRMESNASNGASDSQSKAEQAQTEEQSPLRSEENVERKAKTKKVKSKKNISDDAESGTDNADAAQGNGDPDVYDDAYGTTDGDGTEED